MRDKLKQVATAAMEPGLMGYAPTFALRSLFEKTGLAPADIDIVELNEAFASQAVGASRAMPRRGAPVKMCSNA